MNSCDEMFKHQEILTTGDNNDEDKSKTFSNH